MAIQCGIYILVKVFQASFRAEPEAAKDQD